MNIIGIQGCFSKITEEFIPRLPSWFFHDSSAALFVDGHLQAAVEEERLNRVKHTNKAPLRAFEFCLDFANISRADIQAIALPWQEEFTDEELYLQYIDHPEVPIKRGRELLSERFGLSADRIYFVEHHKAHAYSAFYNSGFADALILVSDGQGERSSISVYRGGNDGISFLHSYPISNSLGFFYRAATRLLGYSLFDEYKVMGLAPYGDTTRYSEALKKCYSLTDRGGFSVSPEALLATFPRNAQYTPRRRGVAFSRDDMDLAAGVQGVLLEIISHVVKYWVSETGLSQLCLAGGVAHNCSANGHLASLSELKRIFVHPASHDAGAALGAAMVIGKERFGIAPESGRVKDIFWGPDIGSQSEIDSELLRWRDLISFSSSSNVYQEIAAEIAAGAVVGWMQGRSEYGPRALGHRSILADPRPASNKDRINAMVKKREAYRPFAPAVAAEVAHNYFDLGSAAQTEDYEFMTVIAKVLPEKRTMLGAVTHVDGTARVQTVDADRNPHLWKLIKEFGNLTEVPVLLNTSFNNHAEPIVDSVLDGIRTFLTTKLDLLVIGSRIVRKKTLQLDVFLSYIISLPPYIRLEKSMHWGTEGERIVKFNLRREIADEKLFPISPDMFELLSNMREGARLSHLLEEAQFIGNREKILSEVVVLWSDRVLSLEPAR